MLEAVGSLQLCAEQLLGVEAAIHAVRSCFDDNLSQCVLVVDATNAFNSLNHQTTLRNIYYFVPPL